MQFSRSAAFILGVSFASACASTSSSSDSSPGSPGAGSTHEGGGGGAASDGGTSTTASVCETHAWPMDGQCGDRRTRTPRALPRQLNEKWTVHLADGQRLSWLSGVVDDRGRLFVAGSEEGGATTLWRFDLDGHAPTAVYRYETSYAETWTTSVPLAFRAATELLTVDGDRVVSLDVSGDVEAKVIARFDAVGEPLSRLSVDPSGAIYAAKPSTNIGPTFDGVIARVDAPKVAWTFPWTEHPLHDFVVSGSIFADEGLVVGVDGKRIGTSSATILRPLAAERGTVYGAEVDVVTREVKSFVAVEAAKNQVRWKQAPPSIVHVELLRVGVVDDTHVHVQWGDKILFGVSAADLGGASATLDETNPQYGNAFFVDREGAVVYTRSDLVRVFDASGALRTKYEVPFGMAVRQVFPGKDGLLYAVVDESARGKTLRSSVVALGD